MRLPSLKLILVIDGFFLVVCGMVLVHTFGYVPKVHIVNNTGRLVRRLSIRTQGGISKPTDLEAGATEIIEPELGGKTNLLLCFEGMDGRNIIKDLGLYISFGEHIRIDIDLNSGEAVHVEQVPINPFVSW